MLWNVLGSEWCVPNIIQSSPSHCAPPSEVTVCPLPVESEYTMTSGRGGFLLGRGLSVKSRFSSKQNGTNQNKTRNDPKHEKNVRELWGFFGCYHGEIWVPFKTQQKQSKHRDQKFLSHEPPGSTWSILRGIAQPPSRGFRPRKYPGFNVRRREYRAWGGLCFYF